MVLYLEKNSDVAHTDDNKGDNEGENIRIHDVGLTIVRWPHSEKGLTHTNVIKLTAWIGYEIHTEYNELWSGQYEWPKPSQ